MSFKDTDTDVPLVTITSYDQEGSKFSQSSRYKGRRKWPKSSPVSSRYAVTPVNDDREEHLHAEKFIDRMLQSSWVARLALYIIPIAVALAIPIALTATVFRDRAIGDIRLIGLFVWIEIIWLGFWVMNVSALALPFVFQFLGSFVSRGSKKYALLLRALHLPMTTFFWALLARGTTYIICTFDESDDRREECDDNWIMMLRQFLLATVTVTTLFFAEKILVHLLTVSYRQKQFSSKIKEGKRLIRILALMYHASRDLFPTYGPDFEEEDQKIDGSQARRAAPQGSWLDLDDLSISAPTRNRLLTLISNLKERFAGRVSGKPRPASDVVLYALGNPQRSEALARRLWMSFVPEGNEALLKEDLLGALPQHHKEEAKEIFDALDHDKNGDVSLAEMVLLVKQIGQARRDRERSILDINQAIKTLDNVFTVAILLISSLIYAAFFDPNLASKGTAIWTSFTGLSFAIAGTAQEFLASCVFLFVKHPYDVGDRVEINKVDFTVERISLMFTVFRQVDNGCIVQISNQTNNTAVINNVSRSQAMKEIYKFSISHQTKFVEIEKVEAEMLEFVLAAENRRDFQPDVSLGLNSVGNLKELELLVNISYKSNWSNEQLRATRRSKFMTALLAALRKHSIQSPGGNDFLPVGVKDNPSFSVQITNEDAIGRIDEYWAGIEAKRLKKLTAEEKKDEEEESTLTANLVEVPTFLPAAKLITEAEGSGKAAAETPSTEAATKAEEASKGETEADKQDGSEEDAAPAYSATIDPESSAAASSRVPQKQKSHKARRRSPESLGGDNIEASSSAQADVERVEDLEGQYQESDLLLGRKGTERGGGSGIRSLIRGSIHPIPSNEAGEEQTLLRQPTAAKKKK